MSRKYDNIPGYPSYYVTRSGKVYSRKSGEWRLRKLSFALLHKDIGKIMGVSSGTICRALNRKTYRDENID